MSSSFKSYRDLEVWQKGIQLAKAIYQLTMSFPSEERFGLTNQMRRAAVSIPSNIAEGHARLSTAEFQRFLAIAMGSVAELETQIILSTELDFLSEAASHDMLSQLHSIGKMGRGLYRSLTSRKGREK